ncbi:hypothetical protein [Nocardia aurantia]|uniref:Uncharacterized protein n=1 Tax=Nocardia aurantia TaxID=2585199 RepID=A0A7K0DQB6_9NOCA|nr:hypothetical protein [Nocardia aurantia]MQY27970.1 hypothetical protein [Nocardia aurantia]
MPEYVLPSAPWPDIIEPYRKLLPPQRNSPFLRFITGSGEFGPPRHAYRRDEILPHEPGYGIDPDLLRPPPGSVPPAAVRAARVIAWVDAAVAALLVFVTALTAGAETAGSVLGIQLCALVLGGLAFRFEHGGIGVRNAAVVLAVIALLIGAGGLAHPHPTGVLGVAASIAIAALLFLPESTAWFRRPWPDQPDQRRPLPFADRRPPWTRRS